MQEPLVHVYDSALSLEHCLGIATNGFRQLLELITELAERLEELAAHRLVQRALVEHRERLGRERGIIRQAGECPVQLGRALAEEMRRFDIRVDQLVGHLRWRLLGACQQ